MSFEFEMPESTDAGGGGFVEKPGWYHFAVLAVDEEPTARDGSLINGFAVDLDVLDGDEPSEKKKQIRIVLFSADLSRGEKSVEFARKRQARFCLAVDILPKGRKPGEAVQIDLQQAVGRQLVAKLQHQKDRETKEKTDRIELAFAELYHVDDPHVAKVAKDKAALGLLPASMRKKPTDFGGPEAAKAATHAAAKAKAAELVDGPATETQGDLLSDL